MESGRGMVVFDVGRSWCVGGWGVIAKGKCGPAPVHVLLFSMGNVDQSLCLCAVLWEMWTGHCPCLLFYGKCGPVTVPVVLFSMGNVD